MSSSIEIPAELPAEDAGQPPTETTAPEEPRTRIGQIPMRSFIVRAVCATIVAIGAAGVVGVIAYHAIT